MLQRVDRDDVDQLLDVVIDRALTEVDPAVVVGSAVLVERITGISADCITTNGIEELADVVIVVLSNPLAYRWWDMTLA